MVGLGKIYRRQMKRATAVFEHSNTMKDEMRKNLLFCVTGNCFLSSTLFMVAFRELRENVSNGLSPSWPRRRGYKSEDIGEDTKVCLLFNIHQVS